MFLRRRAEGFVLGFAADIGFVGFNDFVLTPDGATTRIGGTCAETMEKEPRGFIGRADHAVELVRGHAFL